MEQKLNPDFLSASALAFVGDAVFTLFVRRALALKYDYKSGELTKRAAKTVSAVSQSRILGVLEDELNQDETLVLKRCRNSHSASSAKNAGIVDYRRATGLEGLLGYLYLKNDPRLEILLQRCLQIYDEITVPKEKNVCKSASE